MNTRSLLKYSILAFVAIMTANATAEPYLWPLPFTQELTSIFGDFRPRRYHVGIDVRTGGEIGKAVVAPMDGYISRVRTSYFGYGRALHLTMKDGNSAVFGHLSAFAPQIEQFIREKQIKGESYTQDVEVPAEQFGVKRGDTIAFSGSTGVGAPHLHLEVRTPANVPLNPLTLPGLAVEDKLKPEMRRLRLIGFGNDELALALGWNLEFPLHKGPRDSVYSASVVLPCGLGSYWLAVEANDRMILGGTVKPIYEVEVTSAGRELYRLRYDRVPFEESYLIDIQRNFDKSSAGSEEFYNLVPVELPKSTAGICEWMGGTLSPLAIVARDAAGNSAKAVVSFYDATGPAPAKSFRPRPDTLKLARLIDKYGGDCGRIDAALIPAGRKLLLLVGASGRDVIGVNAFSATALEVGQGRAALGIVAGRFWIGAIDSLESSGSMIAGDSLAVTVTLKSGESYIESVPMSYKRAFADEQSRATVRSSDGVFAVQFPKYSEGLFPLAAQLYFRVDRMGIDRFGVYSLAPEGVPIARQVIYEFKLPSPVPRGAALYSVGGGSAYLGGEIDNATGVLSVKANTLAPITVKQDTLPPTLSQVRPGAGAVVTTAKPVVSFKIADNLSGVREKIDVYIDGRWIIPVFDYETAQVTAAPHFELERGKHKLEIRVTDRQGNVRRHSSAFTYGVRKKK